nr:MAG TPA: hypothetical protein [Caudoviricetes sp.]
MLLSYVLKDETSKYAVAPYFFANSYEIIDLSMFSISKSVDRIPCLKALSKEYSA